MAQGLENQTLNTTKGEDKMKYNYSKLLGRMKERGLTQEQLAKEIGKNKSTISAKINNQFSFTQEEMVTVDHSE